MNEPKPTLAQLRWTVLATILGVVLALAFESMGVTGPWRTLALVAAVLTAAAVSALIYSTRNYENNMREAADLARQREHERSELQRELERHNQLEQQLRQAKQDAESAVMAKGEFLATMSHEIRTPLNGIVPMLDLLMHNKLPPDQAEMVHTAYLSSQQMLRIVDDILDYSKLEASKLQLESTTFNLRETMEAVIQLMERPAQSKGLRLNLQIDSTVRLPVRGDPVRLRQVLSNLISNAVKFTERGSISVGIRRIGETSAQHQLRFEVRDTGIGIPLAAQERLFQAFSQADASTTRLYGGTGLGLAISKRIIDLMGGRIGVESEPGQGALFWFEIPLLKVQGDIAAPKPVEATGGRVLLLTGDQRLRLRLSMLLPNWGLRITTVETTQEALERLRAAAVQGPPWAYSTVIADLSGMRNTAVALQRNLERQNVYGQIRLVALQGDEPVPEELGQAASLLPRQAPDADLRSMLLGNATQAKPSIPSFSESIPVLAGDASPLPPAPAEPAQSDSPTPNDAEPAHARVLRVLLVEDNPVNLMVGQRLLSVLGTHCDTATNGEAALLRMSASRYDLVLMDCQMPVMDGYTATRRWREHEAASGSNRRLPIVAMTANAMAGDRQKCLDAGMDDYLAKPVTRSELERCLFHWQQVAAQNPSHPVEAPAEKQNTFATEAAPITQSVASTAPHFATTMSAHSAAASQVARGPAPPSEPAVPILDQSVLDELRGMLGREVDRLIEVFLDDSPRLIAALESAALGPDFDMLRNAAHTLKSSSANLGAMALSNAAKRVELGARAKSLERPAVAVALIANEFARARQALRANMAQSASTAD